MIRLRTLASPLWLPVLFTLLTLSSIAADPGHHHHDELEKLHHAKLEKIHHAKLEKLHHEKLEKLHHDKMEKHHHDKEKKLHHDQEEKLHHEFGKRHHKFDHKHQHKSDKHHPKSDKLHHWFDEHHHPHLGKRHHKKHGHHSHKKDSKHKEHHAVWHKRELGQRFRVWTPAQGPARRSVSPDGRSLEPFQEDSVPGWTFGHVYDVPQWDGGDKAACPPQSLAGSDRVNDAESKGELVGGAFKHHRDHSRRDSAQGTSKKTSDFCLHGNAPISAPDASTCKAGEAGSVQHGSLAKRIIPSFGQIETIVLNGIEADKEVKMARYGQNPGPPQMEEAPYPPAYEPPYRRAALEKRIIPSFSQIEEIVNNGIQAGKEVHMARANAGLPDGPGARASPGAAAASPGLALGGGTTPAVGSTSLGGTSSGASGLGFSPILKMIETGIDLVKGASLSRVAAEGAVQPQARALAASSTLGSAAGSGDLAKRSEAGLAGSAPSMDFNTLVKNFIVSGFETASSVNDVIAKDPSPAQRRSQAATDDLVPHGLSRRGLTSTEPSRRDNIPEFIEKSLDHMEAANRDAADEFTATFSQKHPELTHLPENVAAKLKSIFSSKPGETPKKRETSGSKPSRRDPLGPWMWFGESQMIMPIIQMWLPVIEQGIQAGVPLATALVHYFEATQVQSEKNDAELHKTSSDDSKTAQDGKAAGDWATSDAFYAEPIPAPYRRTTVAMAGAVLMRDAMSSWRATYGDSARARSLFKRDDSHVSSDNSLDSNPPKLATRTTATCGGTAQLCLRLVEQTLTVCHASTASAPLPKDEGKASKAGKAPAELVRAMTVHCFLKCDGFAELVATKPGFKHNVEDCVGDSKLFGRIENVAAILQGSGKASSAPESPNSGFAAGSGGSVQKDASTLHQRDLAASSPSPSKDTCQRGYDRLFSNAMRPVPSYANKRFGSVVSDPASFLHWGLVRSVKQCLRACDETKGCVFVNVYQQSFSLDNPSIKLVQRSDGTSEAGKGEKSPGAEGTGADKSAVETGAGTDGAQGVGSEGQDQRKKFAQKSEPKKNSFVQGQLTCALYSKCHLECDAEHASGKDPVFFERSAGYCKSNACASAA